MTFVFEASKLHFNANAENVMNSSCESNNNNNNHNTSEVLYSKYHIPHTVLTQLRPFEQRLLLDVLPIVQERDASTNTATTNTITNTTTDNNDNNSHEANVKREMGRDSINVALRIVKALDELDEVYSSLQVARAERTNEGKRVTDVEAAMIAQLYKDKKRQNKNAHNKSNSSSSSSESSSISMSSEDDSENDNDSDIDIAMCFDESGQSMGIGSSSMFGTHGYHPPTQLNKLSKAK